MKRSGSDWFPVPHDEWWDSGEILPLDIKSSDAGIFLFLVGLQCKFGSLPNHEPTLAMMCRRFDDFAKVWPRIKALFPVNEHGRLENPWMGASTAKIDAERAVEAERKRAARASKRGLSGGRPRTSTPESAVEERREEDRKGQEKKPRADRAFPQGDHPELIRHWESEWLRTRSKPYVIQPKDAAALAKMLKLPGATLAEAKVRCTRLLESTDGFDAKKAEPSYALSRWNHLAATNGRAPGDLELFDAEEQRRRRRG